MAMASLESVVTDSSSVFDEGKTFYEEIMALDSPHKEIMTHSLCYKVYVFSPFVNHHCLVLADKEGLCEYVTFELTLIDEPDGECSYKTAPKAQLYTGKTEDLVYKGEIRSTLENVCEVAHRVLIKMGPYNVAFNNCQHFCGKLLKELGLPSHMTDTTKIGLGAAAVGIGIAAYGLYRYLSGNDSENDGHDEKRKTQK